MGQPADYLKNLIVFAACNPYRKNKDLRKQ